MKDLAVSVLVVGSFWGFGRLVADLFYVVVWAYCRWVVKGEK